MTYRVAVVGGGGIAARHLEALTQMKRLQPVAVADVVRERAEQLANEHGIRAYTEYRCMIEEERPDIAVITLPHFLHKEASLFGAEHGCHLLLEKPMALDVQECDEIIAAVRRHNVKMMVGHTQHYIAENRQAKALIDEGGLGRLVMINDTRHVHYFTDQRPGWFFEKAKAGGGILTNLGSHSVDRIQWLSGGRITKVKASVSHFGTKGDIEGSGLVFLENEHGVPATMSQSGYPGVTRNETELIFTNGMIRLVTGQSLWISDSGQWKQVPVEKTAPPFVLQFEDLIRYIEEGVEPVCTMEYSRSVVAVIEQIYRSHEQGKELDV